MRNLKKLLILIFTGLLLFFQSISLLSQAPAPTAQRAEPKIIKFEVSSDASITSSTASYAYCPLPLRKGNEWNYDIFEKEEVVGQLKMAITEIYQFKITPEMLEQGNRDADYFLRSRKDFNVYRLNISDSYQNREYQKDLLHIWSAIYLYQGPGQSIQPYLRLYIAVGNQFNSILVTNSELYEEGETKRNIIVMHHTEKDQVEKYMDGIGLFYYKSGSREYKLKSASVLNDCIASGY